MSYSPARVDKNTNNVWKWKRDSDGAIIVVPQYMWKSADKWSEEEISALFSGTVVVPAQAPAPVQESEPEYAPSDDDDEEDNINPNINDDDDDEQETAVSTSTSI